MFPHLTGPCVTQDSSHINGGVRHNGVIVEFLFGLIPVFELWKDVEKSHGLIAALPSIILKRRPLCRPAYIALQLVGLLGTEDLWRVPHEAANTLHPVQVILVVHLFGNERTAERPLL